MLELKEIVKAYQTANLVQVALNKVSVAFRDNEFVAVLGQSGSGKTTMLNVIGGLDRFQSGDLVIDGISTKDYKARDWDAYRNNRIGFVFQAYNLIPHQSVLANVELALTLSGVSRSERRKRALDALERVGLKDHVNKKPSQMSGGQMQRVAIARALINDPEILLADEPTGALDSKTSVQVMDLLRDVARDRLVIMVTHNPELAHQYATRIVELADGCIVADSDPFVPAAEDRREAKPARRTSMGFLTALSLSFNNLMTKKGRTLMTSFAGSIGIIGIAAILALANGTNAYIQKTEEETLGSYPLTIQKSGVDMTAALSVSASDSTGRQARTRRQGRRLQAAHLRRHDPRREDQRPGLAQDLPGQQRRRHQVDGQRHRIRLRHRPADLPVRHVQGDRAGQPRPVDEADGGGFRRGCLRVDGTDERLLPDARHDLAVHLRVRRGRRLLADRREPGGPRPRRGRQHPQRLRVHAGPEEPQGIRRPDASVLLRARSAARAQSGAQSGTQSGASDATYDYSTILGTTFRRVNAFDKYTWDDTYKVWTDRSSDADYMKKLVDGGQRADHLAASSSPTPTRAAPCARASPTPPP